MFEEIERIISIQNIFHRIGNWDRADLSLHPRDLSSHLVFEPCRRYVPPLNMEGARHCLANLVSLAISATLESSVAYRLPKSLSRSVSLRRASISGRPITVGHGMRT